MKNRNQKIKLSDAECIAQENQIKFLEKYLKHHKKPMNRREFLSAGVIASTASVVLPSALSVVSQAVEAAECKVAGDMPGFINVNLAGGASISGNFRPLTKDGALLTDYGRVGLGMTSEVEQMTLTPFGEKGAATVNVSGMYNGIVTANMGATPTTLQKTAALLLPVRSNDDTANNPIDATPMIAKARSSIGAFLPPLGENRNQPAILPSVAALNVSSFTDITNAIGVNGAITTMSSENKQSLFRMIANLSETQQISLAGLSGADVLNRLVLEATGKNIDLVGGNPTALDPRQVTGLANIWNFNNAADLRDASIIYNVLVNNATVGNFSLGGYDYHQQGRATQDTRDTAAGLLIGRILESAAIIGKPIVVTLTTDGAVGHAGGAGISAATGDDGTKGAAVGFFFDPLKRPEQTEAQVGGFRLDGSGVDETTLTGGSPANAQAAIVANYLSFAKKAGSFADVAGSTAFSTEQLKQIIKIFG